MGKNKEIIRHILRYCNSIKATIERFGDNVDTFINDIDYRNSICMSILQIGELSNKLTDDYVKSTSRIPWKQIVALRNICAHAYDSVDYEQIFEIAHDDIDTLKTFCEETLKEVELLEQDALEIEYDDEI